MRLVVFDIDGTLFRADDFEDDLFQRAIADVFGLRDIDTDWNRYGHVTDTHITEVLVRDQRGSPVQPEEQAAAEARMAALYREALAARRPDELEIPGAMSILRKLRPQGWHVAIATGAWHGPARAKLNAIGADIDAMPAATASDASSREEVMMTAAARARHHYDVDCYARIVYVGDGVWDARACQSLDWSFVGIADTVAKANELRTAGAGRIFRSFLDEDAFFAVLEHALVPCPRAGAMS